MAKIKSELYRLENLERIIKDSGSCEEAFQRALDEGLETDSEEITELWNEVWSKYQND